MPLSEYSLDTLPHTIPVFPLSGILLLPGAHLPLNIFEQRYLDMVGDAMQGDRLIGMIQPSDPHDNSATPALYRTACAGVIAQHKPEDDGRILITLIGIGRFSVIKELKSETRYRRVIAGWGDFIQDMEQPHDQGADEVDRTRLLNALKAYIHVTELSANWESIEQAPTLALVNSVAMACPFAPNEKQAILEASDLVERSRVMTALLEMAVLEKGLGDDQSAH